MREKSILGILTVLFYCSVTNTVIRCHEFIIIMSNCINNCLQLSLETNYLLPENLCTGTSTNSPGLYLQNSGKEALPWIRPTKCPTHGQSL